jgi:sulfopyruvate decarboxylase subunit alpha
VSGSGPLFSGEQIAGLLLRLGITHVVAVPDGTLGQWHEAIAAMPGVRLVRVCREGEAWAIAMGLYLGGAQPLVLIQCTGLFESGDSLRNALHDWGLPLPAIIGYRSYLNQDLLPGDTCLVFSEPILDTWKIPYRLITEAAQLDVIERHLAGCRAAGTPGAVLIAEGRS